MSELICPVIQEIEPSLGDTSTFGRGYRFSSPSELGIAISFFPLSLSSEISVRFRERDAEKEYDIYISTFPHMSNRDFVRTRVFTTKEEVVTGNQSLAAAELSNTDTISIAYGVEHPERLSLIEGDEYLFVAGQKPDSTFVDGWLKKTSKPSWRVSIPTQGGSRLILPDSRLLIFA